MIRQSDAVRDESRRSTSPQHVLVVGGGCVGLATADHLVGSVDAVTFAGEAGNRSPRQADVTTVSLSPTDAGTVRAIRKAVGTVDAVVAVGPDSQSLYAAHLCCREFDPAVTVATLDDPDRRTAFHGTDVEPVLVSELLAERVTRYVREA